MWKGEDQPGCFVATTGWADPLGWEAVKEHRFTFPAPSPVLLRGRRPHFSMRQDEDEPSCLMATAGWANPLGWEAVKEHRFTFMAPSPS